MAVDEFLITTQGYYRPVCAGPLVRSPLVRWSACPRGPESLAASSRNDERLHISRLPVFCPFPPNYPPRTRGQRTADSRIWYGPRMPKDSTRRDFLRVAGGATACLAHGATLPLMAVHGAPQAQPAAAPGELMGGWFDRPMRWVQLTLVENDPGRFDPQFWLDYFK